MPDGYCIQPGKPTKCTGRGGCEEAPTTGKTTTITINCGTTEATRDYIRGQLRDLHKGGICDAYWVWEDTARIYRDGTLDSMKWDGIGLVAGGIAASMFYYLAMWAKGNTVEKVVIGVSVVSLILAAFGAFAIVFPEIGSAIASITNTVNVLMNLLMVVEGLTSNPFTAAAADAFMFSAGGPFYLLVTMTLKFIAALARDVLNQAGSLGLALIALGTEKLRIWSDSIASLNHQSVVGWCNHHGGCGNAPQNIFTFTLSA